MAIGALFLVLTVEMMIYHYRPQHYEMMMHGWKIAGITVDAETKRNMIVMHGQTNNDT